MNAAKGKAPTAATVEALSVKNQNFNQGINVNNSIALTIGTTSVREAGGLYSLNDLHKASGEESKHRPNYFLETDQTKEMAAEILKAGIPAFEVKRGKYGGTYACKELVIAYAAWISAKFHLKVIRVFLNAMQTATRPFNPAIDYDRISPTQAQDLKELVHSIVDAKVQGFAETWARLHRKFRVNSYLELPAAQFDDARDYLLGKLPEATVSSAPTLRNRRWLLATDFEGREVVQPIPDDASIISFTKDSYYGIVERIPMDRIPDMLGELQKRVASHIGAFSQRLQRDNAQRSA